MATAAKPLDMSNNPIQSVKASYEKIIDIIRNGQSRNEVIAAAKRMNFSPGIMLKLYDLYNLGPLSPRNQERNKEIFNAMIRLLAQEEIIQLNTIYATIAALRREQILLEEKIEEYSKPAIVYNEDEPPPAKSPEEEQTIAKFVALQEELAEQNKEIAKKREEIEKNSKEIETAHKEVVNNLLSSQKERNTTELTTFKSLLTQVNEQRAASGDNTAPVSDRTTQRHDDSMGDKLIIDFNAVATNRSEKIDELESQIELLTAQGALNSAGSMAALTSITNQLTLIELASDAEFAAIAARADKIQEVAERVLGNKPAQELSGNLEKDVKLMSLPQLVAEYQRIKDNKDEPKLDDATRDQKLKTISTERAYLNNFFGAVDPNNKEAVAARQKAITVAANDAKLISKSINNDLGLRNYRSEQGGPSRSVAAHAKDQASNPLLKKLHGLLDTRALLSSALIKSVEEKAETLEKIQKMQEISIIGRETKGAPAKAKEEPAKTKADENNLPDNRPSLVPKRQGG